MALGWSKSNKFYNDSAERAERILRLQNELFRSGYLNEDSRPDFQSYAIVILAYANSIGIQDKVVHARRLLDELLSAVQGGEMKVTRNSAAPFSAVISSAARSPPMGTIEQPMSSNRENELAFNTNVNEQIDPYLLAMKTYNDLKNDTYKIGASADHHTFSALLRCIAQHCPPKSSERDRATKLVFDDACQSGEVSKLVIKDLHTVWGPDANDLGITKNSKNIPTFWKRNVPPNFQ
jgi:hypothetical protein